MSEIKKINLQTSNICTFETQDGAPLPMKQTFFSHSRSSSAANFIFNLNVSTRKVCS